MNKKTIQLLIIVALILGATNTYFIFSNKTVNVDAVKTYCRALADGDNTELWSERTQNRSLDLNLLLLDPQNKISTEEVISRRQDISEDAYIDCLQEKLK